MRAASPLFAAILLAATSAASAETEPLFTETFDGNTSGVWSSSTGAPAFDNAGWTYVSACKSHLAIKMGTGNATGSATTPDIVLKSGWTGASVTVTFQAAAWYGTTSGLTLSKVENNVTTQLDSWAVPEIAKDKATAESTISDLSSFTADSNAKPYSATFTVSGPFQLVFATTGSGDNRRCYLDSVSVVGEEIVSSGPIPLATPNGLAASSVTDAGFSLSWNAVANAVGYEVAVLDPGGVAAGSAVVDPSAATAVVTGLSPDTAYVAKVQAVPAAGSTVYTNSAWSTGLSVTTGLSNGLEWAPVFLEGFGGMTNTTAWGSSTKILSAEGPLDASLTDMDAWYGNTLYDAPSAPRLGNASNHGWMQSPGISLSNGVSTATVRVTFSAIALHANAENVLVFSVLDAEGSALAINGVSPVTLSLPVVATPSKGSTVAEELAGADGAPRTFTFTAPAGFKLKFDASSAAHSNVAIDDILVRQIVDPAFAVLAAPTGVAESDVGKHGFTVSWNEVANATGYEVWLDGAVAGSCASTSTSMELSGLSDGTAYSVQAKALGDNLHFGDSPLSTPISVTTLADAQKIDFTVTGAPAGDVFAGDAVSFTVTAENEATHAAEPVSFSGIAGATFNAATGAFSWTPAESDVGANVATFASGDYSTNVTITVVSALKTETLFHETFAKCEKKWIGTSTEMTDAMADEANWTFSEHCYSGKNGLRIGLKDAPNYGLAMTRLIEPKKAGTISLSFRAAGNVAGSTMTVTSAGGATFSQTVTLAAFSSDDAPIPDEAGYVFGPYDIVVTGGFSLSFTPASGDGRMGVDEILVTQKISARIPDLPAPTGLAVVPESVETNGFSVAWSMVSGATNYAVRVTDASGAVVFSAPFCAAAPAAVSGLADDEVYAVQVRATGDEALWFASPWSAAVNIRTARSPLHATLAFGGWQNAVGDGKVYGGLLNTAAVTALRDNGTNAVVTLESVLPAPAAGPTFEDGVLSWIPDDADTNKTFTISFRMDGTYTTNLSFKVFSIAPLAPPPVTADPVAWDAFGLAWDPQYRAAGYAVRVWTDCPNPGATATRMEEAFAGWPKARPAGWSYHNMSGGYKDAAAPVSFDATGDSMETYDLGGAISSVSFHAAGHSIANSSSELTVVGIASDGTETVLATLTATDIGQTDAGIDRTYSIPEGSDVRKIAWRYTKDTGGVGVGSVVIEGSGFSTPRWLPGWGPAAKDLGLVQGCTVKKPRPGKALGPNPTNKKEDLTEPRANYAEVTVSDAAGTMLATVVAVKVPAPPRSARASMMILR